MGVRGPIADCKPQLYKEQKSLAKDLTPAYYNLSTALGRLGKKEEAGLLSAYCLWDGSGTCTDFEKCIGDLENLAREGSSEISVRAAYWREK